MPVVECPKLWVRPDGKYRVTDFITPEADEIKAKAEELIAEGGGVDILRACFNFVSREIEYVSDLKTLGHREYWLYPRETLGRKKGDCEDTSFLLASLLLASGFGDSDVRVPLGKYGRWPFGGGHAWAEVFTDELPTWAGIDGWYILESTSDESLKMGENAQSIDDGYNRVFKKYSPELYVYRDHYESVPGKSGLYDRHNLFPD